MAKKRDLTEQLRTAILDSEKTRYRLSIETGIDQATLSRFVHRKMGINLDSASKLADVLGLELRPKQAAPAKKTSTKPKGRQ